VPGVDSFTKLMLHCDGVNGGTTFTDDSGNGHNGTANVAVTTATATPKFGTAALANTGAASSYLSVADSADFAVSSAFAIDFWAQVADVTHTYGFWTKTYASGFGLVIRSESGAVKLYASTADGAYDIASGATVGSMSANTWAHIALTWDGSNYRTFLNGALGATIANSSPIGTTTDVIGIAAARNGTSPGSINNPLSGLMDEIRFSNGTPRWTAAFTPPTAPYDGNPDLMPYTPYRQLGPLLAQ
jgi:hypothetical protein